MITTFICSLVLSTIAPVMARVDGDGYLRFAHEGRAVYAKSAKLTAANGKLTTTAGDAALPTVLVPSDAEGLDVDLEGNVFALKASGKTKIGRLVLALFPDSSALSPGEGGLLIAADRPKLGNPGDDTNGVVRTDSIKQGTTSPTIPIAKSDPEPAKKNTSLLPRVVADSHETKTNEPAPTITGGVTITVAATSEVDGDKILLGDIAQIQAGKDVLDTLKSVDLGETPAIGVKRVIDRVRIVAKLRAAGFKPENFVILVPASTAVTRRSQAIKNDDFVKAAIDAITKTAGAGRNYTSSEVVQDFMAPAGTVELRPENMSGVNASNATVVIAVFVDGKRINARNVHLTASAPVGGVKPGGVVKVVFTSGKAQVEVPGIAKTGGNIGESVQVEVKAGSSDTKTTHIGTVISPGVVEVKL